MTVRRKGTGEKGEKGSEKGAQLFFRDEKKSCAPFSPGVITEFPVPTPASGPTGIATGSDGNLWFTEWASNKIGRLTPTGTFTEFPIPTVSSLPNMITPGPDGNLWFTEWVGKGACADSGNQLRRCSQ